MARCENCRTIFWGGVKRAGKHYCSERCAHLGVLEQVGERIASQDVSEVVTQVHGGNCPRCNGPGPVDIHKSYQVVSLLLLTRWVSRQRLTCRRCATKAQIGDGVVSLLLGWWGFPWGLVITPVQIGRNLHGLLRGPPADQPSEALTRFVELAMAEQVLAANPGQCSKCGYDLRGNVTGACPECGLRFAAAPSVDAFARAAAKDVKE